MMDSPLEQAARRLGAVPADIPGLWYAPGYPELTDYQLLDAACKVPMTLGEVWEALLT
jgi:hypothetical protein